jgi:hypothetical protein
MRIIRIVFCAAQNKGMGDDGNGGYVVNTCLDSGRRKGTFGILRHSPLLKVCCGNRMWCALAGCTEIPEANLRMFVGDVTYSCYSPIANGNA